jgi:hypothetical protein
MNSRAPALAALALVTACAGSTSRGKPDSGPEDASRKEGAIGTCKGSPPAVYVTSTLGPSAAFASQPCEFTAVTSQLQLGSVASSLVSGTGATHVTCSVVPSGPHFKVSADVESASGSFTISGILPSSGTAGGITASLEYTAAGSHVLYSGTSCTVALASAATPGFPATAGPPIAGGRVWATVTCDDMTASGQSGHVCEGVLLFRLESCCF